MKSKTHVSDAATKAGWAFWAPVWFFVVAIVLLTIWRTWYDWSASGGDWELAGQSGDFWGGHLAGPASVIAAVLLFAAVILQRRELQLQRHELIEGRKVASQQAKALEAQTEQLRCQNAQSQRRDEFQILISLSQLAASYDQVVGIHGANPYGPTVERVLRAAVRHVWRYALRDQGSSLELFHFLRDSFASKRVNAPAIISNELENVPEELRLPVSGLQGSSWHDKAKRITEEGEER